MNDDFLTADELAQLGLAAIGAEVRISRHALLIGAERIAIGDRSRIDAFSVLSAGERLTIGRNAHIAAHAAVLGRGPVDIGDFASISARCNDLFVQRRLQRRHDDQPHRSRQVSRHRRREGSSSTPTSSSVPARPCSPG